MTVQLEYRINKRYKKCKASDLVMIGENVYENMNGNPLFPNPPVSMASFRKTVDDLTTNVIAATHRDSRAIADKKASMIASIAVLDQLADFVTIVANGDEKTLRSSGFEVTIAKKSTSFGPIANFNVVVTTVSGSVQVSVDAILGARSYTVFYGINKGAETIWQHRTEGKSKFIIDGLVPGQTYIFKMEIFGGGKKKLMSETIIKIIA